MTIRFNLLEIVAADMSASLAFYRRLGLAVPAAADSEPHVDIALPGGLRLAFDTVETIRSFDPDWKPPTGGPGMSIAFDCETPSAVDAAFADLVDAGYEAHLPPWDAFWGM